MLRQPSPPRPRPLDFGLHRYGATSVIRGAAALTIWPPNFDRAIALDRLSAVLLRSSRGPGATIGVSNWRKWLSAGSSRQLRDVEADGVCAAPGCVQAAIAGERYELIAGLLDAPDLMIALWVEALLEARAGVQDPGLDLPLDLLLAAAAISDRVSRAADLGRHRWPDHDPEHLIRVPPSTEYADLVQAVTFSRGEGRDLGPVVNQLLLSDNACMAWRPLLPWRGGFVVARPARLLLSAVVRASEAVARSPSRAEVMARLRRGCLSVVETAARDMDWQLEETDNRRVRARVDLDCRAVVELCVLSPQVGDFEETQDARAELEPILRAANDEAEANERELALVCVVGNGRSWAYEQPLGNDFTSVPVVMRLDDFRLLGDAFRRDRLGLVRALERVPRPPWPRGHSILDLVGILRATEEIGPLEAIEPLDGVEYLHWRARAMAARHPAPSPAGGGWLTVSRWSGSPDNSLFAVEGNLDRFALLVRAPGAFFWVMANDHQAGAHDISVSVCRMLAFWLARLCEAGWSIVAGVEHALLLSVEFNRDLRAPLALEERGTEWCVCFGRVFIELLCRGDNAADRLMVQTLLERWGALSAEATGRLVDAVVPEGRATFMIWPSPEIENNEPELTVPEPVTQRELRELERTVVATLIGHQPGVIVEGAATQTALVDLIAVVIQILDRLIGDLEPGALLDLVRVHERASYQAEAESITLPARAAFDDGDAYLGEAEASGERSTALRSLIERATARRPAGSKPLSLRTELRLRAASQLLLRWGSALEALRTEMASCRIALTHEFGIAVALAGPMRTGSEAAAGQLLAAAPDLMAQHHTQWWSDEPASVVAPDLMTQVEFPDPRWTELNDAMRAVWGFTYDEFLRAMRAASELARGAQGLVAVRSSTGLATELSRMTGIGEEPVRRFIARFRLSECEDYDPRRKQDRPWQTNRTRSYIQRPLVDIGDDNLAFSRHHLLAVGQFFHNLMLSGRLRCEGRLAAAVQQLSLGLDLEFELELARRCQELGLRTASRVKRLGNRKIEWIRGEPLGDIDVLAWSRDQKRVFLLDAKRIAPGLPPWIIRRQARELVEAAAKHRRRLEWVRSHRHELKMATGGDAEEDWRLEAALVLEGALPGAEVSTLDVPAWPIWELPDRLF
jgi:hypothetical protein